MAPGRASAEERPSAGLSGRLVNVTVIETTLVSSTSLIWASGATVTVPVASCAGTSWKATDASLPGEPVVSKSTTGASSAQVTVTATVAVEPGTPFRV